MFNTVENESTLFTGRVHSSGMESGRPRADSWCERTDAEYIRHMHTKHKLWLWKEVSKAEQITCGSTQTYEHNTYSPLRKSTLQQSKQEAKVSNDQTAPVCCSQPSENTDQLNTISENAHCEKKKVECVYWTKITSSSSQQAWRYCSQIKYKASSLHLESMYWMSLRIALDASW